jgi:predicted RecB family nuclease
MRRLSKSRLQSFLQCPKRLWLELHQPELAAPPDAATAARFASGNTVGAIARQLYDPQSAGMLIDGSRGMADALAATAAALETPAATPLFEATFEREGLLIRADVVERRGDGTSARLVEVKSTTSAKPEHVIDCAIQAWVMATSRVPPTTVALAHLDNTYCHAGDGDYRGLLREQDLSGEVSTRLRDVPRWLAGAQATAAAAEPEAPIGSRCFTPYECPFVAHCWPKTDFPLTTLPGVGRRLEGYLAAGYRDVRNLPESLVVGADARRAWRAARAGEPERRPLSARQLATLACPRYYLDFETVAPAIPRWAGTRPYQLVPFQWSLHSESAPGRVTHAEYLHTTADLPARAVAESLLAAVGDHGPVLMYTTYERTCLAALAALCPDLAAPLAALTARLVDLHPLIKQSWYHPAMRGSWSIKAVLPTIAPEMDYAKLAGVQDGMGAVAAWEELVAETTTPERRAEIGTQLRTYCGHDTLAMVRLVAFLEG